MVIDNARLVLVDFGLSLLKGVINEEPFVVGPHGGHRSGSKSLHNEMEEVLNILHRCISFKNNFHKLFFSYSYCNSKHG